MSEDFPQQPNPDELLPQEQQLAGQQPTETEPQHIEVSGGEPIPEVEHADNHGEQADMPQSLDLQTDEWTTKLSEAPIYKKFGKVNAQVAQGGESLQTVLADGTVETTNTAEPGDVIVTNPGGERYILKSGKFNSRYEATDEDGVFKAKGKARITTNPTGRPIKIVAPWGEEQFGGSDALIATVYDPDKPDEVGADRYIIGRNEFNATYVPDTYEDDENKAWDEAHDEKYVREGKTEFLEETKKGEVMAGSHRSEAIDDLYKSYLNGEHVTVDFNGEPMNSREIGELGIDRAYEKYFGYDKAGYKEHTRLESDARSAEYKLKQFEGQYRAKKEVPELVEKSKDLIKPDTNGEWRECLEARATDLYHGADSKAAIDLMSAHSQGASQAELKQLLDDQGHSGMSHGMTMAIIKHFYKAGDSLVETLK